MHIILITVGMRITNVLFLLLSSLVTRKLFVVQHWYYYKKALGMWSSLMKESGFSNMHHYVGFLQIGSHILKQHGLSYSSSWISYLHRYIIDISVTLLVVTAMYFYKMFMVVMPLQNVIIFYNKASLNRCQYVCPFALCFTTLLIQKFI